MKKNRSNGKKKRKKNEKEKDRKKISFLSKALHASMGSERAKTRLEYFNFYSDNTHISLYMSIKNGGVSVLIYVSVCMDVRIYARSNETVQVDV